MFLCDLHVIFGEDDPPPSPPKSFQMIPDELGGGRGTRVGQAVSARLHFPDIMAVWGLQFGIREMTRRCTWYHFTTVTLLIMKYIHCDVYTNALKIPKNKNCFLVDFLFYSCQQFPVPLHVYLVPVKNCEIHFQTSLVKLLHAPGRIFKTNVVMSTYLTRVTPSQQFISRTSRLASVLQRNPAPSIF